MNRLIRARFLVVFAFLSASLVQGYVLFAQRSSPSAAYAPNSYILVSLVALQLGLQLYWIVQMFKPAVRETRNPSLLSSEEHDGWSGDEVERESTNTGEPTQMAYVPLYAMGNLFVVGSLLSWHFAHFAVSQIFMALNTACHLYFVFFVINPSGRYSWMPVNKFTHFVAKTGAGIALLYMLRVWAVLDIGPFRPAVQQQAHCGVLVLLLAFASGPDPTLGIFLLLDLAAFSVGDTQDDWKIAFWCIMGVLSVVIVSDVLMSRFGSRNTPPRLRDGLEEEESSALINGSEEIGLTDLATQRSTTTRV